MSTYDYVIKSGCSTTTSKHYHSEALSNINTALNNNIPSYAVLHSAKVYLKMDHDSVFGTLGVADVNVWFCNNGDDNSGINLISDTTSVNSKEFTADISSYISSRQYPFAISSSYPRIAVFYDSTTRRTYNCNMFKISFVYGIPSYIIQLKATEGGTASCNIDTRDYIQHGTQAVITATPNTGYKFVKWLEDGNTSASRTVTVTGNATYTATFEKIKVTATFKNHDGTVLQTLSVDYGSTPSYSGGAPSKSSTAEYDYTFSGWSPSLSAITSDATYTAQFTATKRKYTLTVSADTGGSVSGGGTYDYGSSVTLTATANACYEFVKWSDGNTSPSRTVTVTGAASYKAHFRINRILADQLRAKKILIDLDTVKAILVDTTKVYG